MSRKINAGSYPATDEQKFVIRKFLEELKVLAEEYKATLEESQQMLFDFYDEPDEELDKPDLDEGEYNWD